MTDKMRQEFESIIAQKYRAAKIGPHHFMQDRGEYVDMWVQRIWEGYQLARQSTDEQDAAWIKAHSQKLDAYPYPTIDTDDVREYMRGRKA